MKNNKPLIIIAVILLNVIVVFMIGQSLMGRAGRDEEKIAEAREYAQKDLCSKAIASYNEAIAVKDTVELRLETIDVYKRGLEIGEFTNKYDVTTSILSAVDSHSDSPELYEAACQYLIDSEDYEECAKLLSKAKAFNVSSDALSDYLDEVRYKYYKCFAMYNSVTPQFDGMYTTETDGLYSFLNNEASPTLKGGYVYASGFANGYAFVQSESADGVLNSFVINKKSERQTYLDGAITSSGVGKGKDAEGNDLLIIACEVGDSYKYFDLNGNELFGDYMFAGRFRNNVAAVQEKNGSWKLINACGEQISDMTFTDVALNEFDECAALGLIVAKVGDRYHIYNYQTIEQVGTFSCEEAKAFWGELAAFCQNGLWGFVDKDGNVAIEPAYEDAKSFSNGVGAVLVGGEWVLIDSNGTLIDTDRFEDVGYLSSNGILFVKTNGCWSYLKFYYTGD